MSDPLRIIDLDRMQEDAFRRGFEAAKAAALEAARKYMLRASSDNAWKTADDIRDEITYITPETTQ